MSNTRFVKHEKNHDREKDGVEDVTEVIAPRGFSHGQDFIRFA